MNKKPIEERKSSSLWNAFFWRPRGFIPSLDKFQPEESSLGGSIKDVRPGIHPTPQNNHPLLVAEIPGGKVIGDTSMIATADDVVIGAMQGLNGASDLPNHWLVRRRRFRIPKRIRGTALMLSANGDNYFHWCFDSLPRWQLLGEAGWDANRSDWVVLGHNSTRFQEQMLDTLSVPLGKRLRCSKWELLQFDQLVLPSMPLASFTEMQVWVCHFLRRYFLPATVLTATKSIYISRRGNQRRRILNELELETRLQQCNFHICNPETMSVREQIGLFASARLIVAPHGAALSNIVFSLPALIWLNCSILNIKGKVTRDSPGCAD